MKNIPAPQLPAAALRLWSVLLGCFLLAVSLHGAEPNLAANRWVQLQKDSVGARRGSFIRYASDAGAFFLWGFMNANPDLLQELPLMEVPEYDMVSFDPDQGRWERMWSKKLPLAYIPRTYSGITSGSERSIMRSPTYHPGAAPRPDLNMVFDQVAYRPPSKSLIYFNLKTAVVRSPR